MVFTWENRERRCVICSLTSLCYSSFSSSTVRFCLLNHSAVRCFRCLQYRLVYQETLDISVSRDPRTHAHPSRTDSSLTLAIQRMLSQIVSKFQYQNVIRVIYVKLLQEPLSKIQKNNSYKKIILIKKKIVFHSTSFEI